MNRRSIFRGFLGLLMAPFAAKPPKMETPANSVPSPIVDTEFIADHIERQRNQGPPFYCGTAFCGHSTIIAAAKCWNRKCEALERINSEADELRKAGKNREAFEFIRTESARYYPELNSDNWPINRSSREMQREYIEKAKSE